MNTGEFAPEQRNGALRSNISAESFIYAVPQWFMRNIQTAEELEDTDIRIWLTDVVQSDKGDSSVAVKPCSELSPQAFDDVAVTDKQAEGSLEQELNCTTAALEINTERTISKPMTEDQSHSSFHVGKDTMDILLDTVASLQTPDRIGRLSPFKASIELCCNMRFGLGFLDELVALIARELNSSLVSFNAQDLEDIALDFYYQELLSQTNAPVKQSDESNESDESDGRCAYNCNWGGSTTGNIYLESDNSDYYDPTEVAKKASECYFGDCYEDHGTRHDNERASDAFLALLNTVKGRAKRKERVAMPQDTKQSSQKRRGARSSPIILYFRNGSMSLTPSQHFLDRRFHSCTPLPNGGHIRGHNIQELVKLHRVFGENIIMIFATTHTDVNENNLVPDTEIQWKIGRCDCQSCVHDDSSDFVDGIHVLPLRVPTSWAPKSEAQSPGSVAATMIQSFKRRLNAQLSGLPCNPAELLEPQCDWFSLFPRSVTDQFASFGFSTKIVTAFKNIIVRCSRKSTVELHDVQIILLQTIACTPSKGVQRDDPHARETIPKIDVRGDNLYDSDGSQQEEVEQEYSDSGGSQHGETAEKYSDSDICHPSCRVYSADELNITFCMEIFDQNALAGVKALVELQKSNPQAGSSSFAAQTKAQSILLYGAPGSGKTLLAQAIAKNLNFNMINVDKQTIYKARGEVAQESIRAIFSTARNNSPCIILIDEVDLLFTDDDEMWQHTITTEFIHCLDELEQKSGSVFVLATTNRPWDVNPPFLRRARNIPVRLPDTESRIKILKIFLEYEFLTDINLDQLARATENFSVPDLQDLCSQTISAALQWGCPTTEIALMDRLFEGFAKLLANARVSRTDQYLDRLEKFGGRFGPMTHDTSQQEKWTGFPLKIQKMINWIESKNPDRSGDSFFWEKRFLSLIVKAKDMEISWSDLAVNARTEQEIKQVIDHSQNSGAFTENYGLLKRGHTGGALIYGPPGTGKTQLARVLAHERDMILICVTPADIQSKYYGETPKSIQALFNLGKLLAPSIIFIDEADAVLPRRDKLRSNFEMMDVNQFLTEMDGLSASKENPFILLATNFPGNLDAAVLRRVPSKFYFGLPDTVLRVKIFNILLREETLHPAVDIALLAVKTYRFTGSDIRALCTRAAIICQELVKNGDNKGRRVLTISSFEEALSSVSPTATKSAISSIKAFANENHPTGIMQMQEFEYDDCSRQAAMIAVQSSRAIGSEALEQSNSDSEKDPDSEQVISEQMTEPQVSPISLIPLNSSFFTRQAAAREVPTTENVYSGRTVSPKNIDDIVPVFVYRPLPKGSKRIRVLSISPLESESDQSLISCTLNEVDLEDWTPAYRAFHDMLPEFEESLRLAQSQIQHAMWNLYTESAEKAQSLIDSNKLRMVAKIISDNGYCDQPIERFPNLRDRYSWGDYIALSYVWGDQQRKKTIRLNDRPFEVGLNLYEALFRLRSSDEIKSRRLNVWIDAICINQNDLREREVEVKKMDLIYSKALAVRGWLGHPSNEVTTELPRVRELLKFVFSSTMKQSDDPNTEMHFFTRTAALGNLDLVMQNEDDAFSLWIAVEGILAVPYWKRLWIIQEIGLGSSIIFWYGDFHIRPKELIVLELMYRLKTPVFKLMRYVGFERSSVVLYNLTVTVSMLAWLRLSVQHPPIEGRRDDKFLMDCIAHATYSRVTDARDKVFGLLALLPPIISSQIWPNYDPNVTWRDVWIMFTQVCFRHSGNLNLLSRVNRSLESVVDDYPTWAINLGLGNTENLISEPSSGIHGSPNLDESQSTLQIKHYFKNGLGYDTIMPCASDAGFHHPLLSVSNDARFLHCEGVFVDKVGNMAASYLGMLQQSHRYMAARELPSGCERSCPDPKLSLSRALLGNSRFDWGDGPCIFDVPWLSPEELQELPEVHDSIYVNSTRRLRIDNFGIIEGEAVRDETEWTGTVPWERVFSQEQGLRTIFSKVIHPNELFKLHDTPLRKFFTSKQDVCADFERFSHHLKVAQNILAANCIFETGNGRIGWVTGSALPGDRIAIIFGCDMPVVLRQKEGQNQVIGGCFIDGLMNGEMREHIECGTLVSETITLC